MSLALRRVTPAERRARLAERHLLTPTGRAATAEGVVRALVGLHATDPATVFLSAAARMDAPTPGLIDRALYDTGDLIRVRCMRRTMFVVPAGLAATLHAASVTDTYRRRPEALKRLAEAAGWDEARYARAEADLLAALAVRGQATSAELTADVPALAQQIVTFPGKPYESRQRICGTVLGVLAAEGRVRRARPAGSWTSAQFRWALSTPFPELPAEEARADLARRYLAAFGPVTVDDLKWWTGWTVTYTRKAIAATGAEAVELDEGIGYLLPEDAEPPARTEPRAALLPGLDPTPMGRRHRDWYLDRDHTGALFDRNGNIGPTIWWDGRVIGAWAQRPDGDINHRLLTDPGTEARAAVADEIGRLRAFLGATRVTPCYRTPLERRLAA
ncbi:winged helix DNA-binding domain-containing protein [Streptomyces sp. BG9H]|uniref:Winged helix DNA-binding domain-containing protein n=1 Tax=Streptomyces anatolicus TaxID=2675858 RepID=A0ABS6YRN8_9ACTN|nr:winged helix DNA-binding domain-containing protein [Streptomyces anatolicus]MBW5423750.1 winged helix DNA-binding domain-containing protein [Streptomyces anatolicus]